MRTSLTTFPLSEATHAAQALNCLVPIKADGQEDAFVERLALVAGFKVPPSYAAAFGRWQAATARETVRFEATTVGPLAAGLGNVSPHEVGLALHHTYGLPYLPGSALKGLAYRSALEAQKQGKLSEAETELLFGRASSDDGTDAAGYVTFWDGWLMPTDSQVLQLDTVTVHHQQYYGSGRQAPTDFDDPNPVSFLSVPAGLKFELRISGDPALSMAAAQLLGYGLQYLGLGGKTNAGYGSFKVGDIADAGAPVLSDKQKAQMQSLSKFIDTLKVMNAEAELRRLQGREDWKNLPTSLQQVLLERFLARLEADGRTKGDKKVLGLLKKAIADLAQ